MMARAAVGFKPIAVAAGRRGRIIVRRGQRCWAACQTEPSDAASGFPKHLGAGAAFGLAASRRDVDAQSPVSAARPERDAWTERARRLADPVLRHLAAGTLRARMPVEQAAGADRRALTHLEAVGRLLSGIAPGSSWTTPAHPRRPRAHTTRRWRAMDARVRSNRRRPTRSTSRSGVASRWWTPPSCAQAVLRAPRAAARRASIPTTQARPGRGARLDTRRIPARLQQLAAVQPPPSRPALALRSGPTWDRMRVDYALRQHEQWYQGDGHYGDGPSVPLRLLQQLRHPADARGRARRRGRPVDRRGPTMRATRRRRVPRRYAADPRAPRRPRRQRSRRSAARWRTGAARSTPLAQAALATRRCPPGRAAGAGPRRPRPPRSAARCDAAGTFDADGWLRIGLCGHQPARRRELHLHRQPLPVRHRGLLPLGLPPERPRSGVRSPTSPGPPRAPGRDGPFRSTTRWPSDPRRSDATSLDADGGAPSARSRSTSRA